jgi:hypothetical protein
MRIQWIVCRFLGNIMLFINFLVLANNCATAVQVLFSNGEFQWERLRNLIKLAQEGTGGRDGKLNLNDTIRDALVLLLQDNKLRNQLLMAVTAGNRLVRITFHPLPLQRQHTHARTHTYSHTLTLSHIHT